MLAAEAAVAGCPECMCCSCQLLGALLLSEVRLLWQHMKLALPANTNQTATVVVMTDVTDIVTDTGHHVLHSMLAWLYSTSIQPTASDILEAD